MKNLKILHLIEGLGSGDAEHMLHTNLKHLEADGIKSSVTTVHSGADFWKKPIEELGVEVTSLNCGRPYDIPAGVIRLRRQIRTTRPNLIHTHLWGANIIGRTAGRLEGIPVISSIHNPEYEPQAANGSFSGRRLKLSFAKGTDRFSSSWCTRMIAVSRFVRDSTAKHLRFPIDRIDVLYNPVEGMTELADRVTVCAEANIPTDSEILLNVSRLSPQKGLVHMIRAMPVILKRRPKARLLSIGSLRDVGYFTRVRREIDRLDLNHAIHLLGEKRNVTDFLSICDVFVFPSEFEGLGIALAEAMAASRACVASDIRPLDEFVSSGENGILVPPANHEALSSAVVGVLEDPGKRSKLGSAARETALEFFEPRKAANRLAEIYRSCCAK